MCLCIAPGKVHITWSQYIEAKQRAALHRASKLFAQITSLSAPGLSQHRVANTASPMSQGERKRKWDQPVAQPAGSSAFGGHTSLVVSPQMIAQAQAAALAAAQQLTAVGGVGVGDSPAPGNMLLVCSYSRGCSLHALLLLLCCLRTTPPPPCMGLRVVLHLCIQYVEERVQAF